MELALWWESSHWGWWSPSHPGEGLSTGPGVSSQLLQPLGLLTSMGHLLALPSFWPLRVCPLVR